MYILFQSIRVHTYAIYLIFLVLFGFDIMYNLTKYNMKLGFHTVALWLNDGHLKIIRDEIL